MKTKLVVTDLTRMQWGTVCIAGYDSKRRCIRPILHPPGISEKSLYQKNLPIIFPFAVVELDLLEAIPQPPHTEDQYYDPTSPRFIRRVQNRQEVLNWSLFENVGLLLGQTINTDFGFYVLDCQGPRSLGTILPKSIHKVIYEQDVQGAWDYRLHFTDHKDDFYRLKITDLAWQYYCHSQRDSKSGPKEIAENLTEILRSREVYIRIGLARGWKKFPERCYLQITGIYTFPDYLDGKIFSDFTPEKIEE